MKIKKGDNVYVISGKDKGRKGKVIRVIPQDGTLVVEGMNIKKKHVRPRKSGEKGQVVDLVAAFPASKVKLLCASCGKAVRVGYAIEQGKKVRICKSCKKPA